MQGVLQYGYGSWDEIYADESLGFPDDIGNFFQFFLLYLLPIFAVDVKHVRHYSTCTCSVYLAGIRNEPGMLLGVAVVKDPEDGPPPLAKPTSKACIKRVKFIVNNLRRYLRKLKVRSLYSATNMSQ